MQSLYARLGVVGKAVFIVGAFFILPTILGSLVGDSANEMGFLIGIGGPIILFLFILVIAADDLFVAGERNFWIGVWILVVYFTSMFAVWYYSTDQVFLLDFGQKVLKMLTR